MSDGIETKIKKNFEDSIIVKQKIIDEGEALKYYNTAIIVPDTVTARIQESHINVGHSLLQYFEDKLLNAGWLTMDK